MKDQEIELIIVFKKGKELPAAESILTNAGIRYRQGMDSSRGKIYFYQTGPKFILSFDTQQEKENFIAQYRKSSEVHEIYTPDWTKHKD